MPILFSQLSAYLQDHPRLANILLLLSSIVFTLFFLEFAVRLSVTYTPDYYSAIKDAHAEYRYPYGVIRFNSRGFPDDEFDLNDQRPRVAYVGDSVTFGVGAGHGYRVSDILKHCYPQLQHMNLSGGLGAGMNSANIQATLSHAIDLNISHVIYLMNLNDISPDAADLPASSTYASLGTWVRLRLDWLRGKSYLYTHLRNVITTLTLSYGFRKGDISYELYPAEYENVIEETAKRIRVLAGALQQVGKKLTVVVLPYEMQISAEAESVYRQLGVKWGRGFLEGRTQQKLVEMLNGIPVLDARWAFVESTNVDVDRKRNGIGQYFVHDRGGRLDWNHPIREGHAKIAHYLARNHILGVADQVCGI